MKLPMGGRSVIRRSDPMVEIGGAGKWWNPGAELRPVGCCSRTPSSGSIRLQRAPYLPGIGVNHDWGAHRGYQCNESERYLKLCNSLIRDASSRQDPIQLRSIDPCFPQIDFFYYFVPFFVTFYSKFTYFWKLLHSSFASLIIHYLFSIKHHEGM